MVVFESKNSFEFDTVMLMRSERLKLSYIQKIILIGHHYERGLSVRDG